MQDTSSVPCGGLLLPCKGAWRDPDPHHPHSQRQAGYCGVHIFVHHPVALTMRLECQLSPLEPGSFDSGL